MQTSLNCNCHSHQPPHNANLYKISSKTLLFFSILLYFLGLAIEFNIISAPKNTSYLIYVFCYFALGYEILKNALFKAFKKEFFNENSLMSIASIGAWIIGEGAEAIAILLFYRIGSILENRILEKSKRSIESLTSLKIEQSKIIKNGEIITINPQTIKKGDIMLLLAGDRIPADGIIIKGESDINNASLNGESLPQNVCIGDHVLAGGINLSNPLYIEATRDYENSTLHKMIKLIQEGSMQKSRSEKFITKFARFYTPTVSLLALCICFLPPLYFGINNESSFILGFRESLLTWIQRGIIFLVVSCPCALVISIPLTFFASLAKASKEGILIKGSNYLEALFNTRIMVFDKTGTLTTGELGVKEIHSYKEDKDFLISLAKTLESHSNHPIAKAITKLDGKTLDDIQNIQETAGGGISGTWKGKKVALGNLTFIQNFVKQASPTHNPARECEIFIAIENTMIGSILLEDSLKEEAQESIARLKAQGCELHILSGDKKSVVEDVANKLGIASFFAEQLPSGKVDHLKEILKNKGPHKVAFIGDGINDAACLALCDIGIAMGKSGSDIALEKADIVLLNDDLRKISRCLAISTKTRKILWENIILALGMKFAIMILGAFGFANLWIALFGDVGVAMLALLNAIRAVK